MTMVERLEMHREIEETNRNSLRRMKVKALHMEMVSKGEMDEARTLLRFLRKGEINLGLNDEDTRVEIELTAIGYPVRYSRNYNRAYIHT